MKEKIISTVIAIAVIAAAFLAGWLVRGEKPAQNIVITEIVEVHDTTFVDRPVYISERVVDTLFYPVHISDTVNIHTIDSIYIPLPRVQREYADSTYHAWVSGVDPALDSLNVYNRTQYITTVVQKPPKHWHVGVSAGYGITTKGLAPYWGVGLSYSLFSF
jgi:hypothetical protein